MGDHAMVAREHTRFGALRLELRESREHQSPRFARALIDQKALLENNAQIIDQNSCGLYQ